MKGAAAQGGGMGRARDGRALECQLPVLRPMRRDQKTHEAELLRAECERLKAQQAQKQ